MNYGKRYWIYRAGILVESTNNRHLAMMVADAPSITIWDRFGNLWIA
jgi:hypothetical protein